MNNTEPQLSNKDANKIIEGLNLLHMFQYKQLEYADNQVIDVLRSQLKVAEQDVKRWENEALIAKEQYTIVKQQVLKKKSIKKKHT